MISTQSLLHGILPYFNIDRFVRCRRSHSVNYFRSESLMSGSKNLENHRLCYPLLVEGNTCDIISKRIFGVSVE